MENFRSVFVSRRQRRQSRGVRSFEAEDVSAADQRHRVVGHGHHQATESAALMPEINTAYLKWLKRLDGTELVPLFQN